MDNLINDLLVAAVTGGEQKTNDFVRDHLDDSNQHKQVRRLLDYIKEELIEDKDADINCLLILGSGSNGNRTQLFNSMTGSKTMFLRAFLRIFQEQKELESIVRIALQLRDLRKHVGDVSNRNEVCPECGEKHGDIQDLLKNL